MANHVCVGLGGACLFIFAIFFGWFGFSMMIKLAIRKQIALVPGSEMRGFYEHFPWPFIFKIYVFNVTNPEEVMKGAVPHVVEVGPYVYDEYKDKINTSDNKTEDSVTYDLRTTWYFNKELTGELTGEEMITIPNLLLTGVTMTAMRTKPGTLNVIKKALDIVLKKPDTIFTTVKVKDLLFDGMDIDCSSTEFAAKALCSVLRTELSELDIVNETLYRLSLFGGKNHTVQNTFKTLRGKRNVMDVGRMIELNHQPKLSVWTDDQCNIFQGTDSTIFPPFLTKEAGLMSFVVDLCRNLEAKYVEDITYKKIPARIYTLDLGDANTDADLKCFCEDGKCPLKGTHDMFKCAGMPITVTLPHCLYCDESLLKLVSGLNPDPEKHGVIVYFEPMSAAPLYARKRLMFSIPLHKVPRYPVMANLEESFIPIMWIEEGIDLDKSIVKQVRMMFMAMSFMKMFRWVMLFGGAFMVLMSGYMFYKEMNQRHVSPISRPEVIGGEQKAGDIIRTMNFDGSAKY